MSIDEQHVALPTLYGAPAYARPPGAVPPNERPFDPDELPLEAEQTDEERTFTSMLPAHAFAPGGTRLDSGKGGSSAFNSLAASLASETRTTTAPRSSGSNTVSSPNPTRKTGTGTTSWAALNSRSQDTKLRSARRASSTRSMTR